MRRAMRWIGGLVLVVLAVVVGLFAVSRLMGPSDEQRAALALLDADDPAPTGRNAFAALWLIEYDVPPEEIEAIAEAGVARYRQALVGLEPHAALADLPSAAEERFARHRSEPFDPPYCSSREVSCLNSVRQRHEEYASLLTRERALVERVRALSGFDYYRSPLGNDLRAPIPRLHWLFASHTASALDFVEGRTEAALDAVCRDVDTWRRIGTNADTLILAMISNAMIESGVSLFADMLAQLPPDHPLPPVCAVAFDPQRMAPDLCPAMRSEARMAFTHMEWLERQASPMTRALLLDIPATQAVLAPVYAHACTESIRRALIDDTPIVRASFPESLWRLECAGNVIGCTLADVAVSAYGQYLHRMQDVQAMLRTVDAMLRLRAQAAANGQTMAQVLHADGLRPEVATWREMVFDTAAGEVGIPLRGYDNRKEWRMPLPGSRLDVPDR